MFSDRAAHCPQCGLSTDEVLKDSANQQQPVQQAPIVANDSNAAPNQSQVAPAPQPQTQPQPATPQSAASQQPDYRPRQQRTQNNAVLYALIAVVIVLALVCLVMLANNKFGSNTNSAEDSDSTSAIPELSADTMPSAAPVVTEQPQAVESVEEPEPDVLPEGSETEEIQNTAAPATTTPAPAAPEESAPAVKSETTTTPVNAPAQ